MGYNLRIREKPIGTYEPHPTTVHLHLGKFVLIPTIVEAPYPDEVPIGNL